MKVDWVDDWPVFNEGKNISLSTQGRDPRHNVPEYPEEAPTWTADLSKAKIDLGWYQKSTFLADSHPRPHYRTDFHLNRYACQTVLFP